MKILMHSLYLATEGEGVRIGIPQIFIRLQGCAIGCINCDSKATWDFDPKTERTVDDVINDVLEIARLNGAIKWASLTGGDPCHPKHIPAAIELVGRLKSHGLLVNLEASGTRIVPELFDVVDFISFDIKTPGTGVRFNPKVLNIACEQFGPKMQIKAVVVDRKDFDFVSLAKAECLSGNNCADWVITPCYENHEKFPMARYQEILQWNEKAGGAFRVIGQQHKWVYGPESPNT